MASAAMSLISVAVSSRTTVVTHRLQDKARNRDKVELAEELFRRSRVPLLASAESLQSRPHNVLSRNFLRTYLHSGNSEEQQYVRHNIVYVLAEHLAWLKVLRREQRFLNIESVKSTRSSSQRSSGFIIPWRPTHCPARSVFRGHQRAIGEVMLHRVESPEGAVTEVLGYAAFCDRLETEPRFALWFTRLLAEVDDVGAQDLRENERLVRPQNELVGLTELLDPKGEWLPLERRERLPQSTPLLPTSRTPNG
ncbi:hypothetical protein ACQPZK_05285 [Micromonospora sp. CA-249363]|uniref:hypothetical protein n=1 Tax=Micromonospora sp. CA-249363 TaxID=3239963 RepID=UPI003D947544